MLAAERHQRILDFLKQNEFADVDSLVHLLAVSPATVRRDLQLLADRGAISRTHGGAALTMPGVGHEPPYFVRAYEQVQEKRAIARLACAHVREGEVIVLDVGSTTLELAKALRDFRNLTVFTASLPIAQVLAQSEVSVVVVGGMLRKKELSVAGTIATQVINQFHYDKFFMGTASVSADNGFTDFSLDDVEVKRAFLARSKAVIALADHSKLNRVSFASICPLHAVKQLITDDSAEPEQVDRLRRAGMDVIVAPHRKRQDED